MFLTKKSFPVIRMSSTTYGNGKPDKHGIKEFGFNDKQRVNRNLRPSFSTYISLP
ncbi:MAG: hypothetical protein JWQ40_1375 [Segetibacter sp.]|jgi:hypothetical protein|nr:hypothetical protein [Segetibacter sp.]